MEGPVSRGASSIVVVVWDGARASQWQILASKLMQSFSSSSILVNMSPPVF